MISARAGQPYEALLEGAPTGLAGTLALTVDDDQGNPVTARATTDIVELTGGADPGHGMYVATRVAPIPAGDVATYNLIWDEGDPEDADRTYGDTLVVWAAPEFAARPAPSEVATLLRTRTTIRGGRQLGEWTDETKPTETQVAGLVEVASTDVAIAVGTDLASPFDTAARRLILYRAAMLVELSYFTEQTTDDQSAYAQYKTLYDEGRKALIEAVAEAGDGGGGDSVSTNGFLPTGEFPPCASHRAEGSEHPW
jgi:hypothetical protein